MNDEQQVARIMITTVFGAITSLPKRLVMLKTQLELSLRFSLVLVIVTTMAATAVGQSPTTMASDDSPPPDLELQYLASSIPDDHDSTKILEEAAAQANAYRDMTTSSSGCGNGSDAGGRGYRNSFWCNPYGDVVLNPCGQHACADCGISTPPVFYATAELAPMFRDQKDDLAFQTRGRRGPVVLETGNVNTDFDAGMQIVLGAAVNDQYRIEGTFMGPFEWSSRQAVRGNDNLFSPFTNFGQPLPALGLDFNNFASIEMESEFNSVELNLRRLIIRPVYPSLIGRPPCVANSFLVGVRHLTLDERFGYLTNSTLPPGGSVNRVDIATENKMTGLQIGMLSQIMLSRGQGYVDFELKGGIYHNEISLMSAYQFANGAGTVTDDFFGTDSRDRTSLLGEISLTYVRQVTRNLTCRVGYNAFWLTGVALASANMNRDIDLLQFGPTLLNHRDNIVFHGPTIGLTFAY